MNGYNLIRAWYNYKFENPHKVKAKHSDFYCYLLDQWNRLGQKQNFGLPTSHTMECLNIGSYNTYKSTLDDLIEFGFVKIIKDSKNQHQSKIVALSNIDKATDKALDKATIKATDEAPDEATDTITKQYNNRTKNKEQKEKPFNFLSSLLEIGVEEQVAKDYMEVRKKKKGANTLTAFNGLLSEIGKSNMKPNECIKICVERNWLGFKNDWLKDKSEQKEEKYNFKGFSL